MFTKLVKLVPFRWQRYLLLSFAFIWVGAILGATNVPTSFVFTAYLSALLSFIVFVIFLNGDE